MFTVAAWHSLRSLFCYGEHLSFCTTGGDGPFHGCCYTWNLWSPGICLVVFRQMNYCSLHFWCLACLLNQYISLQFYISNPQGLPCDSLIFLLCWWCLTAVHLHIQWLHGIPCSPLVQMSVQTSLTFALLSTLAWLLLFFNTPTYSAFQGFLLIKVSFFQFLVNFTNFTRLFALWWLVIYLPFFYFA